MPSNHSSILIIEDDPTYIQVLTYELKQLGWQVNTETTIESARDYLSENQPEIIVSDVFLPDGSGIDFSTELMNFAQNSLVILITGFPDLKQAIETLGGNVYDYLLKPFKVEQLILVIERARTTFYLKKEIEALKSENNQFRNLIEETGLNPDDVLKEDPEAISGNFISPNEMYAKQVRRSRVPIVKKTSKNKEN